MKNKLNIIYDNRNNNNLNDEETGCYRFIHELFLLGIYIAISSYIIYSFGKALSG